MNGNRDVKYAVGIPTKVITTAETGNAVDRRSYDVFEAVVNVGIPSTDDTVTVKLQDAVEDPATPGSPLASDWGDLASATTGAISAAGQKVIQVGPTKGKAFIRAIATPAGDSIGGMPVAVHYVLRGGAKSHPETVADVVLGFA